MKTTQKVLLLADGVINLILGLLLLLFPLGVARYLGVPEGGTHFYPTILGGVIFGIGIALLIEAYGGSRRLRGLGLAGAISINLCGGGVLALWLVFSSLDIPTRGYVILWAVAIIVLLVGLVEIMTKSWKPD